MTVLSQVTSTVGSPQIQSNCLAFYSASALPTEWGDSEQKTAICVTYARRTSQSDCAEITFAGLRLVFLVNANTRNRQMKPDRM